VRHYSLQECLFTSLKVTVQLSLVCHVILVFHVLGGNGNEFNKQYVSVGVSIITILLGLILISGSQMDQVLKLISSSFMCLVVGVVVSPILKTLTETISTDTIYSMVTISWIVHLFSSDYGSPGWIVSKAVATNAAIFAGVCLASRLSTLHAFILLIFVADLFILLDMVRSVVKTRHTPWAILLMVSSFLGLVFTKTMIWSISMAILLMLINLVFPYIFFKLQDMKE